MPLECSPTPEAWMADHQAHYAVLFDDGRLSRQAVEERLADPISAHQVALSALARYGDISRHMLPRAQLVERASLITRGVHNILYACHGHEFGAENAFTEGADLQQLQQFAILTTQAIYAWEKGCRYYRVPSPFARLYSLEGDIELDNIKNNPIELVLMTAAAMKYTRTRIRVSKEVLPLWAKSVCLYGPRYTRNLSDGKRSTKGVTAATPEASAEPVAYSIENLVQMFGWPEEKVRAVCTPTLRIGWSSMKYVEPVEVVQRIKYINEQLLTPLSLARELHITPERVATIFPPSALRRLVYRKPLEDPLPKLRNVLRLIRELSNSFDIPYTTACWLAIYVPKNARQRAEIVEREMAHPPQGVLPESWARATAKHPNSVDKRMRYLRKERALKAAYSAIINPRSLSSRVDNKPIDVPDTTFAPEQLIFGDVETQRAREALETLINAADLSTRQAQKLFRFFGDEHDSVPSGIEQLLTTLRQVAEKGVTWGAILS